jgi:O-antigen/teichoic acid export membrane protein
VDAGAPVVRRFVGQVAALGTGRLVAAGVSAVWLMVAARELTLGAFGSLVLLLSLGLTLSVLSDLGVSSLLIEAIHRHPGASRRATRIVLRTRVRLTAAAALVVAVLYGIAGGRQPVAIGALFAVSMLATACYSTFAAVFRGRHHAGIEGWNEAVSRVVLLAIGWSVLAGGGGLLGAVVVYTAVDVASLIVLALFFARMTRGEDDPIAPELLGLRRAASFGGAGVVGSVYSRLDIWVLALLVGEVAVARYGASYRIFDGVLLPAVAVASLSIPHVAGQAGRHLADGLVRLARMALVLTVPVAVFTFAFAGSLLELLFGRQYGDAAGILRILAVAAIPSAIVVSVLPPVALRSARAVVALGLALGTNLVANLALIPELGGEGAAWTTLGCQALLAAWLLGEVRRLRAEAPGFAVGGAVSRSSQGPTARS